MWSAVVMCLAVFVFLHVLNESSSSLITVTGFFWASSRFCFYLLILKDPESNPNFRSGLDLDISFYLFNNLDMCMIYYHWCKVDLWLQRGETVYSECILRVFMAQEHGFKLPWMICSNVEAVMNILKSQNKRKSYIQAFNRYIGRDISRQVTTKSGNCWYRF